MRIFFISTVIGPLLLLGGPAATAGQSISSTTPIQWVATGDSTADRDTYTQKARASLDEWRQRLDDFSAKAKAKGEEEGNAAQNELNVAWIKAEAEQHKLGTASVEGWEDAMISFENASHDLKEIWDKFRHDQ